MQTGPSSGIQTIAGICIVVALTIGGFMLLIILACTGLLPSLIVPAVIPADADAVTLAAMGNQALQRASRIASRPTLRQVDVDPKTGHSIFLFTDTAATVEIDVEIPTPNSPTDQWEVSLVSSSKLVGIREPAINLAALKVGPAAAARAIGNYWHGCTARAVTLIGSGDEIEWVAFCDLPDGRMVQGTIDNRSRAFRPSGPPAYVPPTAIPSR